MAFQHISNATVKEQISKKIKIKEDTAFFGITTSRIVTCTEKGKKANKIRVVSFIFPNFWGIPIAI